VLYNRVPVVCDTHLVVKYLQFRFLGTSMERCNNMRHRSDIYATTVMSSLHIAKGSIASVPLPLSMNPTFVMPPQTLHKVYSCPSFVPCSKRFKAVDGVHARGYFKPPNAPRGYLGYGHALFCSLECALQTLAPEGSA
jgi:hypothetical protein